MSLNVALNTAVSGLFANQRALAATSENIANVNTADYARRKATFYTDAIPNQFAGVDVNIARAAVDRFLQGAVHRGAADAAAARVVADALSRLEASLGSPADNVSYAHRLDAAFAALATLAANPSSQAAKADAVFALDAAFAAFARTEQAIADEAAGAAARLDADVVRANRLLEEIYRLNLSVPDSPSAGDLLDARLSALAGLVSFTATRNDLGQVTVSAGGAVLAGPGVLAELGVAGGEPLRITLSSVDPESGAASLVNADFGAGLAGGEIRGLLDLYNDSLPALLARVRGAAAGVAGALNDAYAGNVSVGATAPSGEALIVQDTDGRFAVNAAILADPSSLAIARPQFGEPGGANDGAGAAALAEIGASPAAMEVAQSVAAIGSASANAELAAKGNEVLADELKARAAVDSGVNLDEELSNLILYQRAYSANARVIAAVDELWQALLSIL